MHLKNCVEKLLGILLLPALLTMTDSSRADAETGLLRPRREAIASAESLVSTKSFKKGVIVVSFPKGTQRSDAEKILAAYGLVIQTGFRHVSVSTIAPGGKEHSITKRVPYDNWNEALTSAWVYVQTGKELLTLKRLIETEERIQWVELLPIDTAANAN